MNLFLESVGFGLVTASILSLAAVGATLQFGVTNHVNFAYGEFLTLAAYITWITQTALHLPFFVACAIALVGVGLTAVAMSLFVLRPFVRRRVPVLFLLIVTFGVSLFVSSGLQAIWGPDPQSFALPAEVARHIGPFLFTTSQLIIIGIGVISMLAVHLGLTRTKLGKAMRAMSDDTDLAQFSGIDTERMTLFTWFVSGVLAAMAGIVLAINLQSFEPFSGNAILFVIFAAVILGGIGSPYGAMLGAIALGLGTEVSAMVLSSAYKDGAAFAILLLVILLRPQGFIPSRSRSSISWSLS